MVIALLVSTLSVQYRLNNFFFLGYLIIIPQGQMGYGVIAREDGIVLVKFN